MKILGFIVLCFIWGTTWLAIKFSLEGLPPFFGATLRFTVAAILLLTYVLLKKISLRVSRKEFGIIAISAFLIYTLDYGLIYWGEQYLDAGVTAIFFSTFVLFTSIWSNFVFRNETFRWNKFIGLLIGFIGILIVFFDQLILTRFDHLVMLASLGIVIGAAGGAMASVIIKKHLSKMNPFTLTLNQLALGILFLSLMCLGFENTHTIHLNLHIICAVLYLGILGSAFAFVLYYRLLQTMSAITLALIVYITPVIAVITDFLVYGEIISLNSIVGMCIIFLGIGLSQKRIKTASLIRQSS